MTNLNLYFTNFNFSETLKINHPHDCPSKIKAPFWINNQLFLIHQCSVVIISSRGVKLALEEATMTKYNYCPKGHWLGFLNFFKFWSKKPCPTCEEAQL